MVDLDSIWCMWIDGWPRRYNACTEPCDMLVGPCCCGAWHTVKDANDWIAAELAKRNGHDAATN